MRSCSGEGDTVPSIRQLGLAGGLRIGDVVGRVNREGHGDHRIATVYRRQGCALRSCSGESNTVPDVRQLGLANGLHVGCVVGRVDRKSHGDHGVATVHCWQRCRLSSCRVKGNAIPNVR